MGDERFVTETNLFMGPWYRRSPYFEGTIAAGAKSLSAPADQPYGDRNAGVEDPFGNQWYIGTHINDVGM